MFKKPGVEVRVLQSMGNASEVWGVKRREDE
jgi:hypothetical protein